MSVKQRARQIGRRAAAGDLRPCRLERAARRPSPKPAPRRSGSRMGARTRWSTSAGSRGSQAEPLRIEAYEEDEVGDDEAVRRSCSNCWRSRPRATARSRRWRSTFATTPDPDRGYALAVLTGALTFKNVKPAMLRDVVDARGRSAPVLPQLRLCRRPRRNHRADLAASRQQDEELPSLTELIELFNTTSKAELPALIASLLTRAEINERWALVKLATGALRIGLSARLAKTALAEMSGKDAAGDRGGLARARDALRRPVRLARGQGRAARHRRTRRASIR